MSIGGNGSRGIKPLFRWVGGKRKLLSQILPYIPTEFGTYYEPFFGGGALYFSLSPEKATIGDKNPDLINYLRVVRDKPKDLIRELAKCVNSKSAYYAMRADNPIASVRRAARFQYLVNLAFSGVYRVNKAGHFNVPYSNETDRIFFDEEQILAASKTLQGATILCDSFAEVVKNAKRGDLVYFDPPYTVAHDNNGFLEYNEHIFQWEDQQKLAVLAKELAKKGVNVVISNANHSSVKELYDSDCINYIDRKSTVSAHKDSRGSVKEILVVYK